MLFSVAVIINFFWLEADYADRYELIYRPLSLLLLVVVAAIGLFYQR